MCALWRAAVGRIRPSLLVVVVSCACGVIASTLDASFSANATTVICGNVNGGPDAPQANYSSVCSSFGDHGAANLAFNMLAGVATGTTHACASPSSPFDPSGGAGSSSTVSQSWSCVITSPTLPPGTPVNIEFRFAYARSASATSTPPKSGPAFGDFADSGINVTVNFAQNPFLGSYYVLAYDQAPPNNESSSGILSKPSDDFTLSLATTVGSIHSLFVEFTTSSRARNLALGGLGDANCHFTLVWGFNTEGDVEVRTYPDDQPMPSGRMVTAENAVEQLTPPPALGDCYQGACPGNYYCYTPDGDCGASGTCLPIPDDCTELDGPVCGCDGETFANACEAAAVGVSVAHRGPCASSTPGDMNGDNEVDESDRAVLCEFMGSTDEDPNFFPPADLNHDGMVDHLDLQMFNKLLPPCPGDLVTSATFAPPPDGKVDGADLAFLLGAWGNQPSCADMVTSRSFAPPPDGKVDGADLAYLLGAWGDCR